MYRITENVIILKKQRDIPCVYVINHVRSCIRIMKNLWKKEKASIRITKTNTGLNTDYHFDSYRLSIPVNTNIFTTERFY